jgi:hypothetical protein
MQDTTPATLPRGRRLSTFGCLTTQPWRNPEGSCRVGSSRRARLHTFYPARASGPEPVNVYGAGNVLGHNRGSRGSVLAQLKVYTAHRSDNFVVVGFPPPAKAGGLQPGQLVICYTASLILISNNPQFPSVFFSLARRLTGTQSALVNSLRRKGGPLESSRLASNLA